MSAKLIDFCEAFERRVDRGEAVRIDFDELERMYPDRHPTVELNLGLDLSTGKWTDWNCMRFDRNPVIHYSDRDGTLPIGRVIRRDAQTSAVCQIRATPALLADILAGACRLLLVPITTDRGRVRVLTALALFEGARP